MSAFVIARLMWEWLDFRKFSWPFHGRIYVLPYIISLGQGAKIGEPDTSSCQIGSWVGNSSPVENRARVELDSSK